jgi:hypothetical protein
MSNHSHDQSDDRPEVDRRSMLRRGGVVVAATVAGVTAVEALNAGNAQAAPGDSLILGSQVLNDSGAESTLLTSSATGATITVENSGERAPLGLSEQSGASFLPTVSGELANLDGLLYCTENIGTSGPFTTFVYTEITATQVVTIVPQRVLDTRNAAGRSNIVNPSGNLDSTGRLIAGHTINIDLTLFEVAAASAFCNLTAVRPTVGGFMTLFPEGPRPSTSSLNFTNGAILANFAVTGITITDTPTTFTQTVSIFSSATSHVLLDITAFSVGSPLQIDPAILPPAASAATATSRQLASRAKAGTLPTWYRGGLSR